MGEKSNASGPHVDRYIRTNEMRRAFHKLSQINVWQRLRNPTIGDIAFNFNRPCILVNVAIEFLFMCDEGDSEKEKVQEKRGMSPGNILGLATICYSNFARTSISEWMKKRKKRT